MYRFQEASRWDEGFSTFTEGKRGGEGMPHAGNVLYPAKADFRPGWGALARCARTKLLLSH